MAPVQEEWAEAFVGPHHCSAELSPAVSIPYRENSLPNLLTQGLFPRKPDLRYCLYDFCVNYLMLCASVSSL